MKLSFSTLGCPDWSWKEIYATAKDLGLDGIEIRGIANEMYAPSIRAFSNERIGDTIDKLGSLGMEIPILTSGAVMGDPSRRKEAVAEGKDYIDLACKLHTPYIRVLIAERPEVCPADLTAGRAVYEELCAYGAEKKVMPLVETNGPFCDTKLACDFVTGIENAGVLWDLHHPFRYGGEPARRSYENLKGKIRHVHIKDSVTKDGRTVYRMLGHGDVPIHEAVALLKSGGYDGYLSLEWVKRWEPTLEDAGIVFSHFAGFMSALFSES